jgi:hypothetical protein
MRILSLQALLQAPVHKKTLFTIAREYTPHRRGFPFHNKHNLKIKTDQKSSEASSTAGGSVLHNACSGPRIFASISRSQHDGQYVFIPCLNRGLSLFTSFGGSDMNHKEIFSAGINSAHTIKRAPRFRTRTLARCASNATCKRTRARVRYTEDTAAS